jgi:rhodanese-related sulfurtransferase
MATAKDTAMSTTTNTTPKTIAIPSSLANLLGDPQAPIVLDARKAEDFALSEYFLPGMLRWDFTAGQPIPAELKQGQSVVVYCVKGAQVGITGAELLNQQGFASTYLQDGLKGWQALQLPTVKKRADLGVTGETASRWVTRERPKIDRLACPWLILRFIDPRAQFFYVPTQEVFNFAKEQQATAFDIPGAPLEHKGPLCSFDSFLEAFDLHYPALDLIAKIIRGADTDQCNLTPQSAGLLAISLGLSRQITDDQALLAAALPIYDGLYSWAQSIVNNQPESHQWTP